MCCVCFGILIDQSWLHGVPTRQRRHSPGKITSSTTPWDLIALSQRPGYEWSDQKSPVWSLYYEGEPYKNHPTHVFAYYASRMKRQYGFLILRIVGKQSYQANSYSRLNRSRSTLLIYTFTSRPVSRIEHLRLRLPEKTARVSSIRTALFHRLESVQKEVAQAALCYPETCVQLLPVPPL